MDHDPIGRDSGALGADDGWTVDHADPVRRHQVSDLAQPGRLLWIIVELHTDPAWDR